MSDHSGSFVDLALSGSATLDDIEDFVAAWHEEANGRPLHEFLGLTRDEYALWVEQPEALRFILFARRHEEPLPNVLDLFASPESAGEPVAARAAARHEAEAVRSWLIETGRLKA